jgi:hypothetical protein
MPTRGALILGFPVVVMSSVPAPGSRWVWLPARPQPNRRSSLRAKNVVPLGCVISSRPCHIFSQCHAIPSYFAQVHIGHLASTAIEHNAIRSAARRPARGRAGRRAKQTDDGDDPLEPVLGLYLQRDWHPDRSRAVLPAHGLAAQPDHRSRRDGLLVGVRGQ